MELSVEFFPPQTAAGEQKLLNELAAFAPFAPTFYSVTYGAGGSTREKTFSLVQSIRERGLAAAPHLSCVGSTRHEITRMLHTYQQHGIDRLVALRGDLPSGMADPGELRYGAELVEHVRSVSGQHFTIYVAAYPEWHPQAKSADDDLQHFVTKINQGADAAITQFFYNVDAYRHFVDRAASKGVFAPIIPGIMPIGAFSKLARFADACGAEIPRWMRRRFESFGDDSESIRAFGLDVVTQLCQQLLAEGCPGLHFYSMNQSAAILEISQRLGLSTA